MKTRTIIIMIVICAVISSLLFYCDNKHKEDKKVDRIAGIQKDSAKMEREYVPVELCRLRDLVSVARTKTADLELLGTPNAQEGEVFIDVSHVKPHGMTLLLGSLDEEWETVYVKDSLLHFNYSKIGEDSVVACPTFVFLRLVELYEHQ